ncbi:MAG: sarcosine oxidase subunit gamma [Reyranella sp.]|nr:sarcosine oxidase subunit gamma [Reyranella sp.]
MVEGMGPIGLSKPASRLSLRMREGDVAAVSAAAGMRFDMPVNRWVGQRNGMTGRLGPDEWLVIGAEAELEAVTSELNAALSGCPSSIVDVSHRQVGFEIAGPHAEAILNAGCPLDLRPAAAPTGFATRTLLGKAEITLFRLEGSMAFRVESWRSFSIYVHGFLLEAARDCLSGD